MRSLIAVIALALLVTPSFAQKKLNESEARKIAEQSAAKFDAANAMSIAKGHASDYEKVVASRDAARLAELFTTDAVFQNPAGIFKGRPAIQHYREGGFKAGVQNEQISVEGAEKASDVIYEYGTTTIFINSASGAKQVKLRWGGVLKKSNGDWKIALLTATPIPPPKAQSQ